MSISLLFILWLSFGGELSNNILSRLVITFSSQEVCSMCNAIIFFHFKPMHAFSQKTFGAEIYLMADALSKVMCVMLHCLTFF